ncbi:inter-alpha-trypsin inhibitor heavy chain H4-like [Rhinatrema bivittatum]|uniref:inter-alpha-trypsin inhibitor heavy chain H4-like n=1 Tax=Rhinatrema bivittatum TaxID=194408 RepID=UPI00112EE3F1|nr:inter-alpha-trypsin inhibitor heavy chain H4-like [Rhinatrema bivittatum]
MDGQALSLFLVILSIALPSNSVPHKNSIDIYSVHVDCHVSSRFAHTVVTSKVVNRANESREALFEVDLPKTAFITNYSMTIDGVVYPGIIKEKEDAQKQYDTAVSQGQSASLIKATGRKMEKFEVSVNIAAASKVEFVLIYEELLKRVLGKYELQIKVKPKQLVKHFQIDVHIFEPQGISFVDTSSTFMTNELSEVVTKTVKEDKAHVLFKPTIDQQRKSPDKEDTLIDGDLIVSYDVKRSGTSTSDIQIVNGYFVHYFAPPNLPKLPKNVIFVIDKSGSMSGRKIEQTREALIKILDDINPEDQFNFVIFSSSTSAWKESLLPATEENVNSAKGYVATIPAQGGTDINEALQMAVSMLNQANQDEKLPERSVSMIILLTDGQPTSGITDVKSIQQNIKKAIKEKYTLYCLGFGFDVDYKFLEKMALENGGVARRIYEDSDSALQLQGFYQEVANPTLLNIELQYPENTVAELTKNNFKQFFDGSEIVVAGHITEDKLDIFTGEIKARLHASDLVLQVEANVTEREDTFKEQKYIFGNFIERLWACLTIQQQLEKLVSAQEEEKKNMQAQILHLSLKYGFVTPLTSMVVTKPDDQEKRFLVNKPAEDAKPETTSRRTQNSPVSRDRVKNHPGRVRDFPVSRDFLYSPPARDRVFHHPVENHPGRYYDFPVSYDYVENYPGRDRIVSGSSGSTIRRLTKLANYPLPRLRATETAPTQTVRTSTFTPPLTSGDKDPHFILQLPSQNDSFCINIKGQLQTSLNLVSDPDTGIWVTGKLERTGKRFKSFGITYKNPEMNLSVTRDEIILQNQTNAVLLFWSRTDSVELNSLKVSVEEEGSLTITAEDRATIIISYIKLPKRLLKLSIIDGHHFSSKVSGLIGQFYSDTQFESNQQPDPSVQEAVLSVQGQHLTVTRNLSQATILGAKISCWSVSLQVN